MQQPPAEIDVDRELVLQLVTEQHPDLADLPIIELDTGWDNTLWRLGDELLVRLPRRALAAPLAINEQRWLPELAERLPLPIPVPVRVGRPSSDYPWAWSIVPWFEGVPADRQPPSDTEDAARRLGRFLAALHQPAPPEAPHNPYRGVPLTDRAPTFEERVSELAAHLDVTATRRVWVDACAAPPWTAAKVWLHGDPHPANLLVAGGTLGAVVDFGDLCAGDPATDLAGAWMLLPASAMPSFVTAYGGLDGDLERRALGWAVLFGAMFLAIGLDDRPTYLPIGRATLARAIERHRALP